MRVEQNKGEPYYKMYFQIMKDKTLTPTEKMLITYYINMECMGKPIQIADSVLSETLGTERKRIIKSRSNLKDLGYISTTSTVSEGNKKNPVIVQVNKEKINKDFGNIFNISEAVAHNGEQVEKKMKTDRFNKIKR